MNTTAQLPILERLGTLGDATRCRLMALLERHDFTVSECCQVLQAPQPSISRHLKVLADGGWVSARTHGTRRHYRTVSELPPEAAALWGVVREHMRHDPRLAEDSERAQAVLTQREDQARAFFSASADRWDEIRSELYGIRADVLPMLGLLEPDWAVADLGTGTGVFPTTVAPHVRSVIGIDRSREMLSAARLRAEALGNVEFREGSLDALPIDSASIDLATLSLVLHYLVDPLSALREAARILAPGGRLVIVDVRAHSHDDFVVEMGHQWAGFDAETLSSWLSEASLRPGPWMPLAPDPRSRGPLLFVQSARRVT